MLTAAELAAMQATQTLTLTETVTRSRSTLTTDNAGGFTESWATTTFAGRLAPSTGKELVLAGQSKEVGGWTITAPAGTDILAKDRLTINSVGYEVLFVMGAETRETARRVIAQKR